MTALVREPFTLIDGGLSTVLEEMGEHPAGLLWTAAALIDRPEVITAAHRRYVDAGADVVITSSYQASEPGFVAAGLSAPHARRLLASTTAVARAAQPKIVACSVGPFGAYLGDGSEYSGHYSADWTEVRALHRARLEVLVETAPDVFAVETMPSRAEAEIVMEELRALTDAPAWLTFTCADDAHTCSGDVFADAVAAVASTLTAVGVNCTAPGLVEPLLRTAPTGLPFVVYPNHGAVWDGDHKCWSGAPGGVELPGLVPAWLAAGAQLIGGCCGVGTAGIAALAELRRAG
ncbi:MAG TPA: homocysteine S-methyltransferase [Ilumatobacteraceae bacterium]|nr:homocysteine S-methyltransferase [Ilumatobacteraceae bacterium]HRB04709.1 homocysteine S-methyltransferase [Ilumatobacteraceae bacterium]